MAYLFINFSTEDFLNPVEAIRRHIDYMLDNTFSYLDEGRRIYLGESFGNSDIYIQRHPQSVMMETPWKLEVGLKKNVGVEVVSRKGYKTDAIAINEIDEIKNYDADVYVIDEFQFLKGDLKELYRLANTGKKFFIAGLNLTAERKPFGSMGDLLCMSDNVQILTSVCEVCRNDNAIYTYYKGDNKTGDILVGEDCYIPVCRKCYDKLMQEKNK